MKKVFGRSQNSTVTLLILSLSVSYVTSDLLRLVPVKLSGEQEKESQPNALAPNDLDLRINAAILWSHECFQNYSVEALSRKFTARTFSEEVMLTYNQYERPLGRNIPEDGETGKESSI